MYRNTHKKLIKLMDVFAFFPRLPRFIWPAFYAPIVNKSNFNWFVEKGIQVYFDSPKRFLKLIRFSECQSRNTITSASTKFWAYLNNCEITCYPLLLGTSISFSHWNITEITGKVNWYLKDFFNIVLKQMTYVAGTCDMFINKPHYLFLRAIHTVK